MLVLQEGWRCGGQQQKQMEDPDAEDEDNLHWSRSDDGLLKAGAVGLADGEGWADASGCACDSSSTIVGITFCSGLEDAAEGELGEREDEEDREMHGDGWGNG